jgi:hypothetical protein
MKSKAGFQEEPGFVSVAGDSEHFFLKKKLRPQIKAWRKQPISALCLWLVALFLASCVRVS